MKNDDVKYLNTRTECYVCEEYPEPSQHIIIKNLDISTLGFSLIRHHVSYFPEKVVFVHYECHVGIHDGKYPDLIEYNEGDSRKFYEKLNQKEEL